MPQSSKYLRDKFMNEEDDRDGIGTCEKIIQDAGGEIVENAYIGYSGSDPEVQEAIDFLCEEWDYAHLDPTALAGVRGDLINMDEL
jgi:hypothetical protein